MKKFLAILFSVVLTVGAITVLGASVSDPYEFDGDTITNPFWWLYTKEAPETSKEPVDAKWKFIDEKNNIKYYYDEANAENINAVVNIQNNNGDGIYMNVPAAIDKVTVNGKTGDSVAAVAGAGTWIYLSALNEGVNDVVIEYVGGTAKITLKKETAQVETPEPTDAPTEKPTDAPTEKPTDAPTEKPTEKPTDPPVTSDLKIVTQPKDVTMLEGEIVSFDLVAKGTGTLKYEWWYSTDDGVEWKKSNSQYAKTARMLLTMKNEYDGRQYKCKVTDSKSSIWSDTMTIYLDTDKSIIITIQPKAKYKPLNAETLVEVRAKGENLSYQWQISDDKGLTWKDSASASAKNRVYGVIMKQSYQGRQLRCIVSNDKGEFVISDIAVIGVGDVLEPITFISQTNSVKTFKEGEAILLSVDAEGEGLTYQWQLSTDDGMTWKNSASSSAKNSTLGLTGKKEYEGRQYRCIVTDSKGNSVSSRTMTLKLR